MRGQGCHLKQQRRTVFAQRFNVCTWSRSSAPSMRLSSLCWRPCWSRMCTPKVLLRSTIYNNSAESLRVDTHPARESRCGVTENPLQSPIHTTRAPQIRHLQQQRQVKALLHQASASPDACVPQHLGCQSATLTLCARPEPWTTLVSTPAQHNGNAILTLTHSVNGP